MKILQIKNGKSSPMVSEDDHKWLQSQSLRDLLEHFREATLRNKFHNGELGKLFAARLRSLRDELGADEVTAIEKAVNAITDPVEVKGTVH